MKNFIIPTTSAEHLAKSIQVKTKNFEIIFPDLSRNGKRYFPDGEVYMRISTKFLSKFGCSQAKKRIIILHSGMPKPNEGLIELELILQILKNTKAKPVEVFFSYFPYGMQDKVFDAGETNVAKDLIEKLINYYGVEKIYIIDAHFWGRKWVKKYPIINVSAIPILTEKAKKDFGEEVLFLSPDPGGKRRTKISGFKKKRLNSFNVEMLSSGLDFQGKIIAVVDDMIKTGGTLLKFKEIAKKDRAKKVITLITHGVIPTGVKKIKRKYSKLYLTNTIRQKEANINIAELVLKTISKS